MVPAPPRFVSYLRVSTDGQGRSGLGLEAQPPSGGADGRRADRAVPGAGRRAGSLRTIATGLQGTLLDARPAAKTGRTALPR